jgi:hypothetical protein
MALPDSMLFTTSFSSVTGGTLAKHLDAASLILQMDMWGINDGDGLSVVLGALPVMGQLQPFTADAVVDIEADPVPEPGAGMQLALAAVAAVAVRRARCRLNPK